ncbi:PilW family protein [Engelhardtia mirabilis]|uniref:Prepilin-type N-terminal cleavage/methylation domain-containing protein n=1 Tax=Engelhardtia mirabilis TaxID=2528011 RepID=A0A518BLJ1_9BACT|nr:hypothetical protein Pla133_29120 [Planctomycetes bacterium Pla133]QDV02149.1 hypothetical protein Pla86_29110 [Planctomycetes bacterium Pla86]
MRDTRKNRRRGGFTLLELTIGASLLVILGASILESTSSMKRMALTSSTESMLQEQARRALHTIVRDLRTSGFVQLGALDYPHFFDGTPDANYGAPEHAHEQPTKVAEAGDLDFGPNREILFLLPADIDANGTPDVNPADGSLMWDTDDLVSYTVVTGLDGRNTLLRRETDGGSRVIARDVERFNVEDWTINPILPPNAVRVQIYFRARDDDGREYRYRTESWVSLRNGTSL